jgi:hypothetical protein
MEEDGASEEDKEEEQQPRSVSAYFADMLSPQERSSMVRARQALP